MRRLNGLNVAVWLCFLLLFLFYVTRGWDTAQHCSLLNWVGQPNANDAFDIFDKDQSQRWLRIPVEISDPIEFIATKASARVVTDKAISTGTVGLMDSINGWRDAVPVYVCLPTRGVWQIGYLNDTAELVSHVTRGAEHVAYAPDHSIGEFVTASPAGRARPAGERCLGDG
ncbi:hypothetical protein CGCSCA1_v014311 [Colletotrichum siamense]|nr:hypothetical protein CGCSCA1_v014311 [Colletotrichum siamense]